MLRKGVWEVNFFRPWMSKSIFILSSQWYSSRLTIWLCIEFYRIFHCLPPSQIAVDKSEAILIPDLTVFSPPFLEAGDISLKNSEISWCCLPLGVNVFSSIVQSTCRVFSIWKHLSFSPGKLSWNYFTWFPFLCFVICLSGRSIIWH